MISNIISIALLSSVVIAAPVNVNVPRKAAPSTWAVNYLEPYDTYHIRYLALDCQSQHNTTFFDECCHPLLASEDLTMRPAQCIPTASASISAVSALPTASSTSSTDNDSEDASVYSSATSVAAEQYATPTHATSTTTEEKAAAATTQASTSNSGGNVQKGGYATYFYQGGNAGECGSVHSDYDKIVAIDAAGWWSDYQSNDNGAYCGKWLTITNTNNGKSVTAMVADVCPTCDTNNSLDLSVGAFTAIASEEDGQVPIEWYWN